MLSATATSLILAARRKADMETASATVDFETDVEILAYLNEAYNALVDMIIESDGGDLLVASATLTAPTFTLPAAFYRDKAVSMSIGNNRFLDLPRFNFRMRNTQINTSFPSWRIMGGAIVWYPQAPTSSVVLWYVPNATAIGSGDTVSTFGGWDTYLTTKMALLMLSKEDRNSATLERELEQTERRIRRACKDLSIDEPERVADLHVTSEELTDAASWWIPELLPRA